VNDRPTPQVPPGSPAGRELLSALREALNLPYPAEDEDRAPYLVLRSKRASLAVEAIGRILTDRESDPLDQLAAATALRLQIADLPADTYASCGLGS